MNLLTSGKNLLVLFLAMAMSGSARAGTVDDLLNLTDGQQVKLVWLHGVQGNGDNWDAVGADYELMGLDTATDTQPRQILPGPASYANPCISPDGGWILYTDATTNTLYKVKWDGTGKQEVTKGYVLCAWRHPVDNTQWVYFTEDGYTKGKLVRCRLDDGTQREVMLSTLQAAHTLSVSADGTRAGSEFPWPNAGVAYLPDRGWRQYGGGCNANIAPDNSYRLFHMHHSHMQIEMYEDGGVQARSIVTQPLPNRDAWVPRWSTDVRFLTINAPVGGVEADVYFGRFNDAFTQVTRWVKISSAPGQDTKAYAWVDMGLGQYAGEVPYSVAIPAPGGGEWQWNFGDGTTRAGTIGTHAYDKPGTYRITATQGKKTVIGRMEAQAKRVPQVAKVTVTDARHINIFFTKPMTARAPAFTFASGVAIERWQMSGDDRELSLILKADIPAEDSLTIKGFSDQNQQPNAVEITEVKLKAPEWPVNRSALVYRWENGLQKNLFTLDNNVVPVEIAPQGAARLGRSGEMVFNGGAFVNIDMHSPVWVWMLSKCGASNEFTVELVLTPANMAQGTAEKPATILSLFGDDATQRGFRLGQVLDKLILHVNQEGGERGYQLGTLPDANPHHLTVTFGNGKVLAYLDGKPMHTDQPVQGEDPTQAFAGRLSWGAVRHLALGSDPVYATVAWQGRAEGIACYARALPMEEAAQNAAVAARRIAARKPVQQYQVQATLRAKTATPEPANIVPYSRALVVYEYDVRTVIRGKLTAETIRVAHWAIQNGRKQAIETLAIGATTTLTLEKYDDRDDLQNEMLIDSMPDDADIDVFVEAD